MSISLVLVVSHIFFISIDGDTMLIYPFFINLEKQSIFFLTVQDTPMQSEMVKSPLSAISKYCQYLVTK